MSAQDNDVIFRVTVTLKPFMLDGKMVLTFLHSDVCKTAEQARDFGEVLCKAGVAIAWRVCWAPADSADSWVFHSYVKYMPTECAKLPHVVANPD